MSDETTLLPCPFCGGEIPAPTRRYMSVLICPTCNAYGPGNSDMTNDELIAAWNTRAYLNPDGLPIGLTISDDGNLLNWRGENYVKQGTLGERPAKSGADALSRRARDMARNIQGNLGRCLYRRKDVAEMEEVSETLMELADELNARLGSEINGDTSDGYHTFNELYHHRAVLFSVIVRDHRELAWKARKHHDGTMYEDMFIVGIETPKGQATYHYDLDPYWEMFDCEEREFAPEWDGHTPDEAIARIAELGSECDKWKAKAEEAGRAMNAAAGLWAKADAENRELRKMLLLDDGTVEEYTERADPLTALAYQKQLAEEWRDRCHNAEALCDKLEAERDELNAKLGSGTCELHYGEDDDGYDGWYCDECSGWFQAVRRDGHLVKPKHCQECGKAVKR